MREDECEDGCEDEGGCVMVSVRMRASMSV